MSTNIDQSTGSSSTEMKKCFNLLEEGEKIIRTDQKDALLVVGNTGSGKTTLVQFLAGNNTELYAEEDSPGEFLIVDKKNRISSATLVSKTTFPDLTIDREYNVGIYDCPGFVDTRGAAVDIAATYFIRKVIQSIEQVKIIITVNYPSVRKGVDRGDFLELVRHILSLVKNVDKYCGSFALVVTKVDNTYIKNKKTKSQELVSDDTIRESAAQFLRAFKENVPKISDEVFSAKVTKLVDALLSKNGTSYERIGIFRRPDEAGPLSENSLLQEGKRFMKKMFVDVIQYTRVKPNDFGYSISDRSKNEIKDLIEEINKTIKIYVQEVGIEMEAVVDARHQQVKDIREFERFLLNVQEKIDSFHKSVGYEMNLKNFVGELLNLIVDIRVNISKKSLSEILKQGKYLDFLELVSERKIEGSSSKWKEGLSQITDYLNQMKEWYSFLNKFYDLLSSYQIQKSKSKFTYLYESTISTLAHEKFKQFTKSQHDFHVSNSLETMKLDDTQITTLNNLIRSTLNTSMGINYDQSLKGHIITGDYVILSDVDNKYLSSNDKVISIFATSKIFIDKNITKSRMDDDLSNFVMVAPTWEIIGSERIDLDGNDGDPFPSRFPMDQEAGSDGENGSPGNPGHAGANFFGIAQKFVNSENLLISANGGEGGPGQNGADGSPGQDGESPLRINTDGTCQIRNSLLDWFNFGHQDGFIWRKYCSYGSPGNKGGNGGNGGIGGLGGPPGSITLVSLDGHKPYTRVMNKNGSNGPVGLKGKGGAGGKAGKSVNTKGFLLWWSDVDCNESKRLAREYGDCSAQDHLRNGAGGKDGYAGQQNFPMKLPRAQNVARYGSVMVKYKEYMRHSLMLDDFNQHERYQFLKSLEQNSALTQTYTVEDLVSEFINLENEYLNLSQDFDWLTTYEHLLKLVELQLTTSYSEHRQVLQSLQKAIISKLCLLKVKPQKTLITQVPRYLDSEKTNLEDFLKEDESLLILNETHKKLQKEITNSLSHVQYNVQPLANKIATMTDVIWKHIKSLVDELITKNQEEKQLQLEKNLISLKVLHGIQETAQLLNAMSTFSAEILSVTRFPNKYSIQNASYEPAIFKLQEILLKAFPAETNEMPKQIGNILVDAMNHEETPSDVKNSLKHFQEIAKKSISLDDLLEVRKIRRDLLRKVSGLDLKQENLQKILQIIEVFLHLKNVKILAIGDETTTKWAEILGVTLKKSTAYDQVNFYVEKLHSVVEKVFSDISTHLIDEIVDTGRISKKEYFDDIKLLLQRLQKSVKLPEDLCLIFQQLLVDVNTISNLYHSLSYLQEFERFLVMKKDIPDSKVETNELKNMMDILGIITESNVVLGQYRVSLRNMEQIVFPFGDLYEDEFSVHSGIIDNVRNITSAAVHKLQTMKSSIQKQGLYLDADHAKLVFNGEFTNREDGAGAFYTWKNKNHKKAIEDLLAGKEVTLKADIVNGVPNDAVKFNSIRIKLTCKDKIMQSELDEDLNNFQVSMVHGEESYYRCGNEFYRVAFDKQLLSYSYRTKLNGEPAVTNSSYDDIKNGVPILSPYTQWSIQIKEGNFEKLIRYKDYVDIELEGQGKWIKDGELICGSNLQKYYTIDDTISEANAVEDAFIDLSEVQLENAQMKAPLTMPQLHRVARSLIEQQSEFRQDIFNSTATRPLLENLNMGLPKQIEMVNNGQQEPVTFCAMAQTSLNNCLLLLDLLVRRFSNVKPKYFDHCSTSYLHAKLCSVEIVRDFDTLVESLCDYPHQYDIDPVPLMELISKDIANENGRNIGDILLKSVKSNGLSVPNEFYNLLRSRISQGEYYYYFLNNFIKCSGTPKEGTLRGLKRPISLKFHRERVELKNFLSFSVEFSQHFCFLAISSRLSPSLSEFLGV